jgi:YgiT-type zinc finger domain-containing protein
VVVGLSREETLMECLHCKGRLVKGTAPFSIDRGGYHLHWDAVAAWVCTQCGEPLFEGREVDVIQEAIKALDKENEKLLTAT